MPPPGPPPRTPSPQRQPPPPPPPTHAQTESAASASCRGRLADRPSNPSHRSARRPHAPPVLRPRPAALPRVPAADLPCRTTPPPSSQLSLLYLLIPTRSMHLRSPPNPLKNLQSLPRPPHLII